MKIGKNVKITSSFSVNPVGAKATTAIYASPGSQIEIGDDVAMSNVVLFSQCSITIEKGVMLGGGVQVYDSDFHSLDHSQRVGATSEVIKSAPVVIEEGAFVGTCAVILKGVIIGSKSIVAAGSIVTKSIPASEIWGGNPAKFIRKL